jgi:hypothetical protein
LQVSTPQTLIGLIPVPQTLTLSLVSKLECLNPEPQTLNLES